MHQKHPSTHYVCKLWRPGYILECGGGNSIALLDCSLNVPCELDDPSRNSKKYGQPSEYAYELASWCDRKIWDLGICETPSQIYEHASARAQKTCCQLFTSPGAPRQWRT